jgi:hypothetical protein
MLNVCASRTQLLKHVYPLALRFWDNFFVLFLANCLLISLQINRYSVRRQLVSSESDDAELSDCTLIALNYLEQAYQRKIGKKS